jgi:hypothetical protein
MRPNPKSDWGIKSILAKVKVDSGIGLAMVNVLGIGSGVDVR